MRHVRVDVLVYFLSRARCDFLGENILVVITSVKDQVFVIHGVSADICEKRTPLIDVITGLNVNVIRTCLTHELSDPANDSTIPTAKTSRSSKVQLHTPNNNRWGRRGAVLQATTLPRPN